ncbi:non-canonical purine NTP pyrophosphatase [Paraliobacillus quinghaiensis]|uniref:dITP/XTP pyrophosphatase n=1 Tax=Paraliobacillus quinghaiensis TaxID=470815 RepID=A0A917TKY7_9BACI|nr:XTP/dITP diphosphatase [Paraliobacillus quinghaiensis]GGM27071.1 non-canonical purine NTP pyrophosphatase [Paraliobacillus quinghaiensis]
MKEIMIATQNKGKVKDFQSLFKKYDIKVTSLLDLTEPVEEVEETGTTFEENALLKAETIANKLNMPVLADDSGLEIDALEGRPGVYSARYAGEEKNDQKNLHKVLEELRGVPEDQRSARFVCVLAVSRPNQDPIIRRGTCEGTITEGPIGDNGFGYDPIFKPENSNLTMAQLTSDQKNLISHRGNALKKIEDWVKNQ